MFIQRITAYFVAGILLSLVGCKSVVTSSVLGSQKVSVCGHMERRIFPGPPNYENISAGDEPLQYWVLVADRPINNAVGSKFFVIPEEGVSEMQLLLDKGQYKRYVSLIGKHIEVRGNCFGAHSGYHCTPLLIEVKDIRLHKKRE